jgi:DNA-binding transcriptional LysR family regulator
MLNIFQLEISLRFWLSMDFDQLHTFLEIVRLKSFSKAAQTCYRTQPAISAQIRQLEHELKVELFERFGSRISLTTAGGIFAEFAAQLLDIKRQAQNSLNELETSPRGELVIAANEATCIYVLPSVFAEYKSQFPGVQLHVNRSYGSRVVEAVLENVADFGLTQLPVLEKRVQIVDIYRDEVRAIVPASHPLAHKASVTCEDLIPYLLLLPQTGMTRTRLNAWFDPVEDELQVSMELDSSETMKRFVIAGLGISFLAASNCRQEVETGALKTIPLAPEPMVRKLGLIYRKDKALPKAALGFIQVILGHFGPHNTNLSVAQREASGRLATV